MELKMKALFCTLMLSVIAPDVFAITISEPIVSANASKWPSSGAPQKIYPDWYLQGGIKWNGTDKYEGAVKLMMAREIYPNGAKFCITQVQAASKHSHMWQWLDYYKPYSGDVCAVFCKDGYSGTKCEKHSVDTCDTTNYDSYFGGFSGKPWTSGEKITGSVEVISKKNQRNQTNNQMPGAEHVVLAIAGKREHGVFVYPMRVSGKRSNNLWNMNSWISDISKMAGGEILCASGWTGHKLENNTYCTQKAEACKTDLDKQLDNLCDGYTRSAYNASQHSITKCINADGNEVAGKYMFRCHEGFAFESSSSKNCVKCEETKEKGPNGITGVCETCERGKIFNSSQKKCVSAKLLTKLDLMYGKGKTENSSTFEASCWPKKEASLYKQCVLQGGGSLKQVMLNFNKLMLHNVATVNVAEKLDASVVLK